MRRMQKVLLLALALLLFAACSDNSHNTHKYLQGTDIALTPDNCNIHQVVTRIYTDEELEELANTEFESIEELNERYPIECVREVLPDNDRTDYYIEYCGDKKYACIYALYDPDPENFPDEVIAPDQQWYIWNANLLDARHDLAWYEDRVKIGTALETIETEVDPDGGYPFHHAGTGGIWSVHYTSDGYYIRLYYTPGPEDAYYSEATVEEIEIKLY